MQKAWDDIPEDEPTEEEMAILEAYQRGDAEYQPTIPQEELLWELGIQL